MDLRDDRHTQVEDIIKTLRILSELPPQPEMVHAEITRWQKQAAMMLEVFILPTIPDEAPLLDLRTGKQGNAHKVAPYVVGATSEAAAAEDEKVSSVDKVPDEAPGFLPRRDGSLRA